MSRIEFPKWTGELGWEVMTWVPLCRQMAKGYDEVIVSSFEGMKPLYDDFATEFIAHNEPGRSLIYPKNYRAKGKYFKYGFAAPNFDILIHARGSRRKAAINYRRWFELARLLKPYRFCFIGSGDDYCEPGWPDKRSCHLQHLMNYMAGAKLTIGVSSGVMHLAAACGCDLIAWGNSRTYFGETLEKRYKETWNPFNVKVGWITDDSWQPEPELIFEEIQKLIENGKSKIEKRKESK